MKKGIIDRFEEDKVVVEMDNGVMETLDRSFFPKEAEVGDVIQFKSFPLEVTVDKETTKKVKTEIQKMMNEVWEDEKS